MNVSDIDDFSDFMNKKSLISFQGKFLRHRPISETAEEAIVEADVEDFLTQSYKKDYSSEDSNYLPLFIERLFLRVIELDFK